MIDDFEIAVQHARRLAVATAFARRYGGQCTTCGVVRDYHGLGVARDHAFNEPVPVPAWTCDWKPDDLNPGPECPYCEGRMCARFDGLGCNHGLIERHGYPVTETAPETDHMPSVEDNY